MSEIEAGRIAADDLHRVVTGLLRAWQVGADDAEVVATSLVDADLRGVDSHGVHLMQLYAGRLASGSVNAAAVVRVIDDSDTVIRLDAGLGLGQVAAVRGIDAGIMRASERGMAAVAIREITHVGALGYYTRRAAEAGCIAIAFQNGNAFVPPYGGLDGLFSTNPFSYAVPGREEGNIVYDIATTAVAGNKILVARTRGDEQIPLGWANDDDGMPTTDPMKASIKQLQWFGGHKGYGLGLMVELMAGVLADSCFGRTEHSASPLTGWDRVAKGCTFLVLDPGRFLPIEEFTGRVDALIRDIRSVRTAPGVARVMVPGELEDENRRHRLRFGIPVPAALVAWLDEQAAAVGIAGLASTG